MHGQMTQALIDMSLFSLTHCLFCIPAHHAMISRSLEMYCHLCIPIKRYCIVNLYSEKHGLLFPLFIIRNSVLNEYNYCSLSFLMLFPQLREINMFCVLNHSQTLKTTVENIQMLHKMFLSGKLFLDLYKYINPLSYKSLCMVHCSRIYPFEL